MSPKQKQTANENKNNYLRKMIRERKHKSRSIAAAVVAAVLCCLASLPVKGQTALYTNAAEWATTTINVGVEQALGARTSLAIDGMLNPWDFSDERHFHLWMARPELRYWFCQPMDGHFVGLHLLGGQYNIKNIDLPFGLLPDTERGRHYEGWMVGFGATYGYQWILSRHWNLEAAVGAGYVYSPYKLYGRCDRVLRDDHRNYVGLTRLSLSISYVF